MRRFLLLLALGALPVAAQTAGREPEIQRPPAPPQAVGVLHSIRTIPEACVRLEGRFTGTADAPYAIAAVRTSPRCQPRARFVDAEQAKPDAASGWRLNDRIVVPNAACPSQRAVIDVWRRPGEARPPALDAQGRARVYLGGPDRAQAAPAQPTLYAARRSLQGHCGVTP